MPLPAVALIWTGPLAWLPIGVAFACAVGSRPLARLGRLIGAGDIRRSTIAAGLATSLASGLTAWLVDRHVPAGDEPHYLVITQSLLADGDLQIENNHRQRDYEAYFSGPLAPHYITRGRDGQIYSIHAPGVSALVLPAFAAAGYRGVQVFLVILAGFAGSLIWRLGWRATGEVSAAWFAWAAVAASAPFLLHSHAVFPDGPGALGVAIGLLLLLRQSQAPDRVRPGWLLSAGVSLAALPWLHSRFAVLAGGIGLLIVMALLRDASRPLKVRVGRTAIFLSAPLAGAVGWFGFFQLIYGTPNPAAPYGGGAGTRAAYVPGGLAGLLFDEQFGVIAHAPVLILMAAGALRALEVGTRRVVRDARAVGALYLAIVATYWLWWAGTPANPGRFAVAALPIAALPVAAAWRAADAVRRRAYLTLLLVSVTVTAILVGIDRGDLAWNMRTAEARWLDWLSPVANLPRGWPSFFWALDPSRLVTEVPFAIHVAAWIGVFALLFVVVDRLSRAKARNAEGARVAVGAWLLVGLTAAVQVGWTLTRSKGLDAARSQMAMLSLSRPIWELSAFTVRRRPALEGALRIRGEEPGRLDGPAPWLQLEGVPAGQYRLHVGTSRPRTGQLLVTVGRGQEPIRRLAVQPVNRQTAMLMLPAGMPGLTIAPADGLDQIAGTVELEPLHIDRSAGAARAVAVYGSTNVYFLDNHAFVEQDGFWVAGGSSAAVVIEPGRPDRATVSIALQNGGAANVVEISGGPFTRGTLAPFERRVVELPLGQDGIVRLAIRSSSGFRPSARGGSADSRYLGVRISVPD